MRLEARAVGNRLRANLCRKWAGSRPDWSRSGLRVGLPTSCLLHLALCVRPEPWVTVSGPALAGNWQETCMAFVFVCGADVGNRKSIGAAVLRPDRRGFARGAGLGEAEAHQHPIFEFSMWARSPTFSKAFPRPRGRPDLKNTPQKPGQTAFRYPAKCT